MAFGSWVGLLQTGAKNCFQKKSFSVVKHFPNFPIWFCIDSEMPITQIFNQTWVVLLLLFAHFRFCTSQVERKNLTEYSYPNFIWKLNWDYCKLKDLKVNTNCSFQKQQWLQDFSWKGAQKSCLKLSWRFLHFYSTQKDVLEKKKETEATKTFKSWKIWPKPTRLRSNKSFRFSIFYPLRKNFVIIYGHNLFELFAKSPK